jgi:hypothetical protein
MAHLVEAARAKPERMQRFQQADRVVVEIFADLQCMVAHNSNTDERCLYSFIAKPSSLD